MRLRDHGQAMSADPARYRQSLIDALVAGSTEAMVGRRYAREEGATIQTLHDARNEARAQYGLRHDPGGSIP